MHWTDSQRIAEALYDKHPDIDPTKIFITGWSLYRYFSRKFSLAQDLADLNDNSNFKNNFRD